MNHKNCALKIVPLVIVALMLAGMTGCSDKTTNAEKAPALPPQSSFIMDFSGFSNQSLSAGVALDALSRVNWGQSALRLAIWNLVLTVNLVVPTAAFVEAFNHEPVRQTDGSWEWSYSVLAGVIHTCRLNGKVVGDQVQWRMYISKAGEYNDYLWYSGSHNLAATQGSWTVNRNPNQSNPYLQIDWRRNPTAGTGDLKYINVIPGDAENGGYIFYGSLATSGYDRFYQIYDKVQDNLAEIEWNHLEGNGRVKDQSSYGDSNWHCWDTNLDDIACP